jgi:hypothetical protein
MKYLISLLFIIASILGGAYYLLFTGSGNDILKPFINSYISTKSGEYDVNLENFRLTPSTIEADIMVNNSLDAKIDGSLNLLSQEFDLNYLLVSESFKMKDFALNEKIDLKGTVKGTPSHVSLEGLGKAINSNLKYSLKTEDKEIHDMHIDIEQGSLRSFLLLANQKPYLTGKFDIHVDMPKLDIQNPTGKASLVLHRGKVNIDLIKEDFNITLPEDFRYSADIHSKVKGTYASLEGTLKTTLANLFLREGKIYIKSKKVETNYTLEVPKLSKLESIIGKTLSGTLKSTGVAEFDKGLKIRGNSKSFGGDIAYTLKGAKLDAKITSVPLTNIFHTLIAPKIFEGLIFGDVTYNLTTSKGKIDTKIESVKLLPNQVTDILKNHANINLTKERYNQTTFTADLNENLITFDFDAKSKKSYIAVKEGLITKDKNTIDAKFDLKIDGKDFSGTIKGDIKKPNVQLDSSKYLKQKVSKEISKFIDKKISDKTKQKITDKLKKFGLGDTNSSLDAEDALKGLIKGFF